MTDIDRSDDMSRRTSNDGSPVVDTAAIRAGWDRRVDQVASDQIHALCDALDAAQARADDLAAANRHVNGKAREQRERAEVAEARATAAENNYLDERDRHVQTMKRATAARAELAELKAAITCCAQNAAAVAAVRALAEGATETWKTTWRLNDVAARGESPNSEFRFDWWRHFVGQILAALDSAGDRPAEDRAPIKFTVADYAKDIRVSATLDPQPVEGAHEFVESGRMRRVVLATCSHCGQWRAHPVHDVPTDTEEMPSS